MAETKEVETKKAKANKEEIMVKIAAEEVQAMAEEVTKDTAVEKIAPVEVDAPMETASVLSEEMEVPEEEGSDEYDESKEYISATEGKKLLTEPENYLKHGMHIGLTYRTGNMKKFIYKVRQDRLSIFSLNSIDERIRLAAKMLARFDKEDILIIGSRAYARRPVRKFAESSGVNYISGRFLPGSFTNPRESNYREPKIILVADPIADRQAVREAARVGIPIIGVCDSHTLTRNLDLIIPLNNKGKQSIALMFWLLAKQHLIERGEMKETDEMKETVDDFISQIQPTKRIETLIKAKKKEKFRT